MKSKSSLALAAVAAAAGLLCFIFLIDPGSVIGGKPTSSGGGASSIATGPQSLDLEKDQKQFLSIIDRNQTGLDVTGDLTLEAWVKLESLPESNGNANIIDKTNPKGTSIAYSYYWRNDPGGSNLNLLVSPDGSTNYVPFGINYPPRANEWTHLAAVFNSATSKTQFYVNGQPITDNTGYPVFHQIFDNNHPFYIGARAGAYDFLDGKMDEIRMWNKARTSEEILANYKTELTGSEAGLVGYWKFNGELTSGKMKDSSPNKNDLSLTGSPTFSSDVPF